MDIEKAMRFDRMGEQLRQFTRSAQAMGATPSECATALMDMAATIYAVEISGAVGQREQTSAKRAFVKSTAQAITALPNEERDARVEAELRKKGL